MMNKSAIRASALRRRKRLDQRQRSAFSHSIITSLFECLSDSAIKSECLLMYRSMLSEVATTELLQTDAYSLFAPVTERDASMKWLAVGPDTDWKKGVFGVMEPAVGDAWHEQSGTSVLICPLAAFDRQGSRLGMGKGCFDVWLSQYRPHITQVIGLAFSCQEVAQVPVESHDMPLDVVITEQEVIRCIVVP